jgi:hypothetical protein
VFVPRQAQIGVVLGHRADAVLGQLCVDGGRAVGFVVRGDSAVGEALGKVFELVDGVA